MCGCPIRECPAIVDAAEPKDLIRAQALALGFDQVGFASAATDPDLARHLAQWLKDGRQGTMGWMAERVDQRASPGALWDGVRSVIVLGSNYAPALDPLGLADRPDLGVIAAYARNRDYHDLVKKRLKALGRWMVERFGGELKVFVDTAPVMEKPLGQKSGLGWQGRHTNLVSRRFGSWLFLSEIYTSLDLPADAPHADQCGRCTACQDACPTGAIEGFKRLNPLKCVSYLTIEHKGPIPDDLKERMGNRIYGCDDCLAVCPWNKFATPTQEADFMPRVELCAPRLTDLVTLTDADFRDLFTASPIKRIGRDRFVRNVLVAMGNGQDAGVLPLIRGMAQDPDAGVADAARWAMLRLSASRPAQAGDQGGAGAGHDRDCPVPGPELSRT